MFVFVDNGQIVREGFPGRVYISHKLVDGKVAECVYFGIADWTDEQRQKYGFQFIDVVDNPPSLAPGQAAVALPAHAWKLVEGEAHVTYNVVQETELVARPVLKSAVGGIGKEMAEKIAEEG